MPGGSRKGVLFAGCPYAEELLALGDDAGVVPIARHRAAEQERADRASRRTVRIRVERRYGIDNVVGCTRAYYACADRRPPRILSGLRRSPRTAQSARFWRSQASVVSLGGHRAKICSKTE
jgi:hypothetical protein